MLQVLLVEDHNIVRNGIKMLLETDKDINVVAEAENGVEALAFLSTGEKVDIILADINMPELDGMMLLKELNRMDIRASMVMLSMHDNEKYVIQAFEAGAMGYLLKNVSAEELIFSLKHVNSGGKYLCSELCMRMLDKCSQNATRNMEYSEVSHDFSDREIEILTLIAEGLTNSEISEKLFISKRTVEGHRQGLIEKTGSRNTAALIHYAILNGLIH
ncbi:response regulator transcription factor [Pedobacter gandavensis]|uniref:response regulator transcription factor n=1 Tax=Pedobacter TaxID=84567 RepID=UPI001C99D8E1|nr:MULTISPECIES: response regulator transcription factor [Pedobacter]WGQ09579.1 response regulator transcription factor [Pedobacter gandavensis]